MLILMNKNLVFKDLCKIVLVIHYFLLIELTAAAAPSSKPTIRPSKAPVTRKPTFLPTTYPSEIPSSFPTNEPSFYPSDHPTIEPTFKPSTKLPTKTPSAQPSILPTNNPSCRPTISPAQIPSIQPIVTNQPFLVKEPTGSPTSSSPQVLSYSGTSRSPLIGNSATNFNAPYLPTLPVSQWFIILGAIMAGCICCGGFICFCFDRYRGKKVTPVRAMDLSSPTSTGGATTRPGSSAFPGGNVRPNSSSIGFNPMTNPPGGSGGNNTHYRNSQTAGGSEAWRGEASVSSVASYGLNPGRVGTEDYRLWEQSVDGPSAFDPFSSGPNSAANSRVNSAAYYNNGNYNGYNNHSTPGSRVTSGVMTGYQNGGDFPVYDPQQYQFYEPEIVEAIAIPLDR